MNGWHIASTSRNACMKCWCSGYWFPHRHGGGACETSKTREIHLAKRSGDRGLIAEAHMNHALSNGVASSSCPF